MSRVNLSQKLKLSESRMVWRPVVVSTIALACGMLGGSLLVGQSGWFDIMAVALPMAVLAVAGMRLVDARRGRDERSRLRQLEVEHARQSQNLAQARERLLVAEDTKRAADAKARHLLEHDGLTDLPNRRYLQRHLAGKLAIPAGKNVRPFALMLLDLDRFKDVNDTLGHPAGDELLKLAARRLRDIIPNSALAARMGGDEFAVVTAAIDNHADAALLAETVVHAFREPFTLAAGHRVTCQASVGIALHPDHGTDADTLIGRSDLALYEAKSFGRGRYSLYSRELHLSTEERRTLESELSEAVEEGQFVLHFQPRFSLSSRRITAIEALLRWNHPERGELQPADFIGVAESTGQIDAINFWTIEQACREARIWEINGRRLIVSVNLSPVQFRKPDIARRILQVIDRTGLSPELLELEITETVCTRTISGSIERELQRIKGMGVRLAIDDFGMGYSSLAYLKWLPFDTIKIDQSFVGAMTVDDRDRAVVQTVITLAKNLKKTVVAEGVETDEQLDLLLKLGCDEAQGYLLNRPMPIADLVLQLERNQAA